MEKSSRKGDTEDQHRPKPGLNHAFPDEVLAKEPGVVDETPPFVGLLGVGFDDLNARNRFGEPCVHGAELLALRDAHRLEPSGIVTEGEDQGDREEERNEEQTKI